ncbi:MoaD family protein [Methanocalculus chunghsingensis]|uniref:MoaD family protein n=1 Tax=Methanocalculus chunghsingensis TaxID=156457 RepID=A0A8J7WBL5_9EURY|nr:ubiquitin-like small modifier protein 1 [Methanocalculus chunghsingensis]MBR1369712.1 MoaD family protein [Methanocalculus chunghsingensis]
MKITVKSFATLRDHMDAEFAIEIQESATIADLLTMLTERYPKLEGEIFLEDGTLKDFVNILLNGRNIAFIKGLDSILSEGDRIALFPPAGGG